MRVGESEVRSFEEKKSGLYHVGGGTQLDENRGLVKTEYQGPFRLPLGWKGGCGRVVVRAATHLSRVSCICLRTGY